MTNEINHAHALMNFITALVILGGIGIFWFHFSEWLYGNKPIQKNPNGNKKRVSVKKMKTKKVH